MVINNIKINGNDLRKDRHIKPINAHLNFGSNHHYKECHLDIFYNKTVNIYIYIRYK